ncbi:Inner membrane transport protein YnfM [Peribacillus sp. Bi96]|uniref:MFS transporter n=1 Tax=unclassified Peribacillus TaxID=2675266 RepID=UPI001D45BBAF|nr:MFS transporter [Peribacillus sp. Bi96]CAH0130631.1 Inner membrane transport protein YnfM [Peribacillus sp. Bi96]
MIHYRHVGRVQNLPKVRREAEKVQYIESGSREYRLALIGLLLGSIVSFSILYSPQPLISLFSEKYHVSPSTASFAVSLPTVSLAISLLFISTLSNAYGRKTIMSLSLILTSILAIASSFTHYFHVFLAIRFLEGVTISGFPSIAMAYLNEEFSPKSIGRVIGVYVAGNAVGGFVGRIVIGTLTDLFSWQIALMVLGMASLLCSLWFFGFLPESKNFRMISISFNHWAWNMKEGLRSKNLLCVYGIGFLFMGVYVTLLNYLGYPLTKAPYNLSQTVFSFVFVVNLIGIWSSVWFGKLADRYSCRQVISWSVTILLFGALLTLHDELLVKITGITVFTFGFFAGHTAASGWVGYLATEKQKAQASSFYLLFYYTGSGFVSWYGGFFLHHFGWGGIIGFISVLLIIAVLVSFQMTNLVRVTPDKQEGK